MNVLAPNDCYGSDECALSTHKGCGLYCNERIDSHRDKRSYTADESLREF